MKYDKYIGLPYANNGRSEIGIDCWGLVCLFYKNELNIELPSYVDKYDGPQDLGIASTITTYKDNWTSTTTPDIGDVVLFNVYGEPAHVGVYVGNNKFIHSREGKDSVVESLSSPKWAKRFDGFYKYTSQQQLEVVGAPHPLKTSIIKEWTVAGTTVADFVNFVQEKYSISTRLASKLVVMVDGVVVPKDKWDTTVLQQGQKIAYKAVPEGREALRLILIIAVVYLAVNGVQTPEFTSIFGTSAGAKAAGVMVLSQAGMALVNAILPIRPINPNSNDPGSPAGVNLFTGASNQINKFGAIPVVLGKVRMTGMLGATAYVETLTDTSILNMLLVWGFGPLDISDICVGTNSITNYYEGFPQDIPQPITLKGLPSENVTEFDKLYPQDIEQKFPQIELVNNTQDGNPSAEVTLSNPCTAIDIAFTFPEGMRQITTQGSGAGSIGTATAVIEIMMRKAGTTTWENVVPYALGNYNSPTPNTEAYTATLTPPFYTYNSYDEELQYRNIDLYRWTTFALGPAGVVQLDGTPTDRKDFDPSGVLLQEYRAGNYKALLSEAAPNYSRLPTIPPGYLKLHTICMYGRNGIVENISHLSSYSNIQGLGLTVTVVLGERISDEGYGYVSVDLGSRKISIAAGRISEQDSNQPPPGLPETIFTSRQFPSSLPKYDGGWGPSDSLMKTYAVWNAGDAGESFDQSTNVVFPYTGYYTVEATSDDEGYLAINGRKIVNIPRGAHGSSIKNLYYTEAGTFPVRQYAVNIGGPKGVACTISYTANAGLNTPATPNTELSFGAEGFFNKRKDAFNFVYRVKGLERAIYEIKVRRTNSSDPDPAENLHNYHKAILYNVTGYDNTKPMKNPPNTYLARTVLRIQSTNKANGTVDGVNALVQTIGYDWDKTSNTWVMRPINNPASLFLHVLMHPANAYRIKAEEASKHIDLTAFQDWHEYCNPETGVKLTYNNIISNTTSVMDVLRDIAAAGKASPTFVDGKWSVVVDKPRNTVVQHFTPHNSWGFEATKILPKIPDAFRVTIADETKAYQPNELIVYSYGKNESNAEVFESLSLPGVTNADQAIHLARWHMAQLKLRPETYTINVDFEYLVCTRGDVVKVTHDVPLWGTGSGRIKSVNDATVVLTEEVYLAAGVSYNILVRKNDGTSVIKQLSPITQSGYVDTVILSSTAIGSGIVADNLFMLGEVNKESQQLVVLSIEPTDAVSARVTLTDYSPQIYTEDLSSLLVYNTNITGRSNQSIQNSINGSPLIVSVVSDSAISEQISTGTYQNVLIVGFAHPGGLSNNAKRIHVQIVLSNVDFDSATPQGNHYLDKDQASLTVNGLTSNGVYKIRARYTNASGSIAGPWSGTTTITNNGKNTSRFIVPSITLDLNGTFVIASVPSTLDKPTDFNTFEYRLYKDTGTEDFWELDPVTNNILVTQSRGDGRFNLLDIPLPRISTAGVTYRVACRALDRTNNYSPQSALGTIVVKTIQ